MIEILDQEKRNSYAPGAENVHVCTCTWTRNLSRGIGDSFPGSMHASIVKRSIDNTLVLLILSFV